MIAHRSDIQKDNRRQGSLGKLSHIDRAGGETVRRGLGREGASVPRERESVEEAAVGPAHGGPVSVHLPCCP